MKEKACFQKIHKEMITNGFLWSPSINNCSCKTNTLFVGSSTNVFLPVIDGSDEEQDCLYTIQPCIKTHNLKSYKSLHSRKKKLFYKSYFQMLGTIKRGYLLKEDIKKYLLILKNLYGILEEELLLVIPEEFIHYKEFLESHISVKKIIIPKDKEFTK